MHIISVKVLIVDDNPEFVLPLTQVMSPKRYEMFSASNRLQAQEMMETEAMDVVIIGTMMPMGDAVRLHQWMKGNARLGELPVIVVDSSQEKQSINGWWRHEELRINPNEYLSKPIDPMALMSRIEKQMDKGKKKIRVLVADDQSVVRDGICAVLEQQKDIHVVGMASDGKEAVTKALELLPDVILMDAVMPVMNGLEATNQIRQQWDDARILIVSQYDDQETIHKSIESGALGFIPKSSASTDLIESIRNANQGNRLFC